MKRSQLYMMIGGIAFISLLVTTVLWASPGNSDSLTEDGLQPLEGLNSSLSEVVDRDPINEEEAGRGSVFSSNVPSNVVYVEQEISGVQFPEQMQFAGETVPLDIQDVAERLDREMLVNSYWHSNTILTLKLANKYLPEIEAVLAEKGVPADFKYLAIAESGLRNLVSPAKAVGFWQILSSTGKSYGLEVTDQVDERYDYVKSTEAACDYLLEAYEKFGNWTLAAASYNMGMGGVSSRLKEQQVENYYDLYLNTETSRYVFRILALKHLFENQELYGFSITEDQLYQQEEFHEVEVSTSISSLATYAKEQGTNYKTLKLLNPWLRSSGLTVSSGNSYTLRLPGSAPAN